MESRMKNVKRAVIRKDHIGDSLPLEIGSNSGNCSEWHCRPPPDFARRNILPRAGWPLMASRRVFGLETRPKNVMFPAFPGR